jgi:hypothetical protein
MNETFIYEHWIPQQLKGSWNAYILYSIILHGI